VRPSHARAYFEPILLSCRAETLAIFSPRRWRHAYARKDSPLRVCAPQRVRAEAMIEGASAVSLRATRSPDITVLRQQSHSGRLRRSRELLHDSFLRFSLRRRFASPFSFAASFTFLLLRSCFLYFIFAAVIFDCIKIAPTCTIICHRDAAYALLFESLRASSSSVSLLFFFPDAFADAAAFFRRCATPLRRGPIFTPFLLSFFDYFTL